MPVNSLSVNVVLTQVNCGECGGTYAINNRYRDQKQESGGSWTCPYCRTWWGFANNSENSVLKQQLADEKEKLKKEKKKLEWAKQDIKHAKRSLTAQKAATTRLRNRVQAGVCPCCNRTFKQLAAHMKNKHPEFKKDGNN